MHMLDFVKAVFDWQRIKQPIPIKGAKAVCLVCLQDISTNERHVKCEFIHATSIPNCSLCETVVYPGLPHYECNKIIAKNVTSEWQCVICAQDEREGDHSVCREAIYDFRRNLKFLK